MREGLRQRGLDGLCQCVTALVLDTLITLHVTVKHAHKCTHRGTNTTRESQRAGISQKDKNNQKEEWKEALAERHKWSEKQTSLCVHVRR